MNTKNNNPTGGISRRKFLGALGTSVVALGMPNALAVRAAHGAQQSQPAGMLSGKTGLVASSLNSLPSLNRA